MDNKKELYESRLAGLLQKKGILLEKQDDYTAYLSAIEKEISDVIKEIEVLQFLLKEENDNA